MLDILTGFGGVHNYTYDMVEAMSFTLSKESYSIYVALWQFYKIHYCIHHLNPYISKEYPWCTSVLIKYQTP